MSNLLVLLLQLSSRFTDGTMNLIVALGVSNLDFTFQMLYWLRYSKKSFIGAGSLS